MKCAVQNIKKETKQIGIKYFANANLKSLLSGKVCPPAQHGPVCVCVVWLFVCVCVSRQFARP